MKIKGIIEISTIEWKDNVSMIIFFHGCKLTCRGCQNHTDEYYDITINEIFDKILDNKFIDSVIMSGGEPLEQFEDLVKILIFAKKQGLKTAIETNGFYTYRLKYLIEERLIDKVFLDIKGGSKETGNYASFINSINSLSKAKGKVDIEIRTTIFRTFPNIEKIVYAIKPYKLDVLQQGCPEHSKDVPGYEKLSREELITIARNLQIKTIRTKERGEETI